MNDSLVTHTLTIVATPAAATLAALRDTAAQTRCKFSMSDSEACFATSIAFSTSSILCPSWLKESGVVLINHGDYYPIMYTTIIYNHWNSQRKFNKTMFFSTLAQIPFNQRHKLSRETVFSPEFFCNLPFEEEFLFDQVHANDSGKFTKIHTRYHLLKSV